MKLGSVNHAMYSFNHVIYCVNKLIQSVNHVLLCPVTCIGSTGSLKIIHWRILCQTRDTQNLLQTQIFRKIKRSTKKGSAMTRSHFSGSLFCLCCRNSLVHRGRDLLYLGHAGARLSLLLPGHPHKKPSKNKTRRRKKGPVKVCCGSVSQGYS